MENRPNDMLRYAFATLMDCVDDAMQCDCDKSQYMDGEHGRERPLCDCPINGADLVDAVVSEIERLYGRLAEKSPVDAKKDSTRE